MILRKYEKPSLRMVSLRGNAPVADCWNEAASNQGRRPRYYDTTGHGFVEFEITGGGNCKNYAGTTQALRYTCRLNEAGEYCDQMTPENEAAALAEFEDVFSKAFDEVTEANGGSPYKGISDQFPPDPHGMS